MEVGDYFKLTSPQKNCTVGRQYVVHKKVQEEGQATEYWFFNDVLKLSTLYDTYIKRIPCVYT